MADVALSVTAASGITTLETDLLLHLEYAKYINIIIIIANNINHHLKGLSFAFVKMFIITLLSFSALVDALPGRKCENSPAEPDAKLCRIRRDVHPCCPRSYKND